jgi:hypothetical protein
MSRTALPAAQALFPEERELRYKWGFDPKDNSLKLNIYYKDDDTFVIAFTFDKEEERLLRLLLVNNKELA